MKQGFMEHVATILVPEFPGQPALWYAKAFLDEAGTDGSDSKTPEQSLANTLSKQVQTGREKRVRRERIKGVYRFFPASAQVKPNSSEEIIVQLSLSKQTLNDIDNLVALGKTLSRKDAITWLILEGIKTKRAYLDKLASVRNRIELLKKEVEGE
ncbi:MAG: hypothetical protein HY670_06235 [Chloroflexi bacterium]|nr:hypothetical protein [Chloroflexota bacterium]